MPSYKEKNLTYLTAFFPALFLIVLSMYFFGYGFLCKMGWTHELLDSFCRNIYSTGLLVHPYKIKGIVTLLLLVCAMMRFGKPTKMDWSSIAAFNIFAAAVFFLPVRSPFLYILTATCGFVMVYLALTLIFKKIRGMKNEFNNPNSTFEQCEKLIQTPYSVNFRTRYFFNKKWRTGYINVVNPFRGNIIFGVPGSGKSYSILYEYMIQLTEKGFTSFTYDFKYPELTKFMYNLYKMHEKEFKEKYGSVEFCSINFMDPRYSLRVNPLDPIYIRDISDATETSTVIMKSVNPKAFEQSGDTFFRDSAINYWDSIIWFLHEYKEGIYCTFPHFIELLTYSYTDVLQLLVEIPELKTRIESFADAEKKGAQDQLQGQIASARMPLVKMANEGLYWTFSKNDFFLDINNPKKPKFVCIGNFPERQNLYSTALSLITSRVFPIINKPGGTPCAVFGDEIPTVTMKGLDTLIATARSNRVAVVLAAQDRAQLEQLWGKGEARSTLNIFGNHFYGQMIGDNVRQISDLFGSEYREQESETDSSDRVSVSRSLQQHKRLPENKIATLSQGEFAAMISDDFETKIELKQSCSFIQVDQKKRQHIKSFAEDLPMVNVDDFNVDKIKKNVMNNLDEYMFHYLYAVAEKREKDKKRLAGEPLSLDREELKKSVESKIQGLSKDERKKLIDDILEFHQKQEINRVLKENFNKIRYEIEQIFVERTGKKGTKDVSTSESLSSEPTILGDADLGDTII